MAHPDRFRAWTISVRTSRASSSTTAEMSAWRGCTVVSYAKPRRREVGVEHLTRGVDRCETPAPGNPQRSSSGVSHGPEPTDAVRCRSCLRLWTWAAMSSSCCGR